MKKTDKILIIGFGSIGNRHYKNLTSLGYEQVYVYDKNQSQVASCKLKVARLNKKELEKFNIVFICSPNYLHIQQALLGAQAGCHLFIEKPLSHNLKNLKELEKICQQKKIITMIGANMRFHPCLNFIKNNLGKVGKVYKIEHEFGYYLPYWRPNQDYTKNYAIKKETGGGIILDDIHEFDLLFWLNNFSEVKESKFIYGKISDLKIQTEDICVASFKFENNVLGLIQCDYLQKKYTRKCKIIGERGNLEWDFNENIVWFKSEKLNKKLFQIKNYDLNQMYIEELKYFFNQVNKKQKTFNDIRVASNILKYCYERK